MPDLDSLLGDLQGDRPVAKYLAVKELSNHQSLPPSVLAAIALLSDDPDPDVSKAAIDLLASYYRSKVLLASSPESPPPHEQQPPPRFICPRCGNPVNAMGGGTYVCPYCMTYVTPRQAATPHPLPMSAPNTPKQLVTAKDPTKAIRPLAIIVEVVLGLFGLYGIGHLLSRRWPSGLAFLLVTVPWLILEGYTNDVVFAHQFPPGICALAFHLPVMLISVYVLTKN